MTKKHFLGADYRLPESLCTGCGKKLDGATVVDQPRANPEPGTITVCLYCGHIMAFGTDLVLRNLTDDEMREVAGDDRIIAVQRARKMAMERRKP